MRPRPAKRASAAVGVRALKNQTSAVLRRVKNGETITITDRDRPVAVLVPADAVSMDAVLEQLCKTGRVAWGGGKPAGRTSPVRVESPVADAVIEDRR